jgi:hypothetical protein
VRVLDIEFNPLMHSIGYTEAAPSG